MPRDQKLREEYRRKQGLEPEIYKILSVKARTGSDHLSDAVLIFQAEGSGYPRSKEAENRWVLHIDGSPGSWYVSTLITDAIKRGGPPGRLSIDMGQDWWVENYDEVFAAMLEAI